MPPKKNKGRGRGKGRGDGAGAGEFVGGSSQGHQTSEPAPAAPREQPRAEIYQPSVRKDVQPEQRGSIQRPAPSPASLPSPAITSQPSPYQPADVSRQRAAPRQQADVPRERAPPPRVSPSETMPPVKASASQPSGDAKEAIKKLAGISLEPSKYKGQKNLQMAARPGTGREGRPIKLIANYFMLDYKDNSIYHYDVEIKFVGKRKKEESSAKGTKEAPEAARRKGGQSLMELGKTAKEDANKGVSHVEHQQKRNMGKQRCRQVISEMIKSKALKKYNPVYDGQKNIYTIIPFPFKEKQTFMVTLDEDDTFKDFSVIVQPVEKGSGMGNIISLEPLKEIYKGRSREIPQEVVMAYDTVMCHRDPPFEQIQVGRSFFFLNQSGKTPIGEGIEIWFGYNQSIHLTQRGPAVIINLAAKAFHRAGSVIDYACEVLNCDITKAPMLNPRDISTLSDALSKLRVEVTHLRYPRRYAVKGVTKMAAKDLTLSVDGKNTTVARYFQTKYGQLKFPHLPCLHMRSNNNTTYVPFEVCEIFPGQPKLGKLSGNLTAKMIRQTAIPPTDRFRSILDNAQVAKKVSGKNMDQFDLFMDTRAMQLQGRVIMPPSLGYKELQRGPSVIQPDIKGTWRMDGKQFYKSINTCSWVLLSFANERFCNRGALEKFADILCSTAIKSGLTLERPKAIQLYDRRMRTLDALKYAKGLDVTFAVVVLSPRDYNHSYEEVKFIADIRLRLITQCMDETVVARKFNGQVATNVLLKINTKVGGVNHRLHQRLVVFEKPIIIIGADAAHSPRGSLTPSIAAVVGSMDAFPSRYAVTCRVQENPDEKKMSQEIILELKNMVRYILETFKRNTRGKVPERIVFFRDGVSEGQFNTVLENEINMVQLACADAFGGILPPLTFIVVQKRHQTRFRPQDPRDGVGKMGNVPPGTTVDTDVTHPTFFDFFLCSHEGIQGTSKPAHYTVLYDQNKFSADELQKLCYHLCHTYARCNRSISVPAPVMYAHLAASRAKKYVDHLLQGQDAASSFGGSSGGTRPIPPEVLSAVNSMENFDSDMFFA